MITSINWKNVTAHDYPDVFSSGRGYVLEVVYSDFPTEPLRVKSESVGAILHWMRGISEHTNQIEELRNANVDLYNKAKRIERVLNIRVQNMKTKEKTK